MSFFFPDRYLNRISEIDINKDLLDKGINCVLMDVDNTILTRDKHIVPDDVMDWMTNARKAGIKFCLISNDWHKHVRDIAEEIDMDIVVRSIKPLPPAFIIAKKKLNAKNKNTIMIGDQLMTDVFGAHCVGLKCVLVKPLVEQDLTHTLILRKIENIILRNRQPE